MLIRPTPDELANFGEPDFIIYNAGQFPANRFTTGMTSTTSVEINFKRMEMVILGTEYAGEMKKGIFSVMHYLQPVKFGQLSLHSSANQAKGDNGDVTLFFGLSGTGKTTLSADPNRLLIGDDEHVWSDTGVFNIEGGCYAKCINLSAEKASHLPTLSPTLIHGTSVDPSFRNQRSTVQSDSDQFSKTSCTTLPIGHQTLTMCLLPKTLDVPTLLNSLKTQKSHVSPTANHPTLSCYVVMHLVCFHPCLDLHPNKLRTILSLDTHPKHLVLKMESSNLVRHSRHVMVNHSLFFIQVDMRRCLPNECLLPMPIVG